MSKRLPARATKIPGAEIFSVIYSIFRRLSLVVDEEKALRLSHFLVSQTYKATRKNRFANYHHFYGTSGDDSLYAGLEHDYLQYMARHASEVARDVRYKSTFEKRHILRGCEHLDAALKLKRGVMLLGAHLGNFYSYHAALATHGYRITNISEVIPIPAMERHIDRHRQAYGVRTVFLEQGAARAAMKVLKAGEIFSVVFEVTLRPEQTVILPFGHGHLRLDMGPALLAVRLGVPVLAINAFTHKAFYPEAEILPPFPEPTGETEKEKALNLLTFWRDWLQNEVMKRPDQWWAWSFINLAPSANNL